MIIRSQVKEMHICGLSPFFTAETVMSSKISTVNIDILTVNTVICHYNPHNSDRLFDFGIFMVVLVV